MVGAGGGDACRRWWDNAGGKEAKARVHDDGVHGNAEGLRVLCDDVGDNEIT